MTFLDRIFRNSDLALALGLVMILAVMVIPLPPFVIDLLLCLGIAISVVLLLTAVYATKTLDFSVFPAVLLIVTLFRLALNVATTRVILLRGAEEGTAAAGEVINSFGEFVVGGNYAVGIVVFVIIVIINFIVITKGAGRVAEVSARFTLDAMPGKQMSIDADLNAGIISEEQARTRREEISQEADFYGAMDGASKFVRGDAIAGILIVMVNIIGGIVIGTLQKDMGIGEAAETFVLLTIGDGLVGQIPAIVVSLAAGIIVTRTVNGKSLGSEFSRQLLTKPTALFSGAGIMGFLALIPALPSMPFLTLGLALGGFGYRVYSNEKKKETLLEEEKERERLKPSAEKLENLLSVDVLELEVGYGLVNIVDVDQNGDLLERITNIRKQFALDLGIIVPPLRIRDNLELKPGDYQVLLKGEIIGKGSMMIGHLLAMDPGNTTAQVSGVPTKEPAFGLDALWITENQKDDATYAGYTVVDLSTVIATHVTEMIRQHAHELLGRQELQTLLDGVKEVAPKVVEDLIPNIVPFGVVLKVLRNLLKESVSIRDLRTILETIADVGPSQKDPDLITEHVRVSLSRTITKKLVSVDGTIPLLTLEKEIEETIAGGIISTDQGQQLSVDPEFVRQFIAELNDKAMALMEESSHAVVLCSPMIRHHLKSLVDRFIPNVVVLSHNEIGQSIHVRSFDTVRLANAS